MFFAVLWYSHNTATCITPKKHGTVQASLFNACITHRTPVEPHKRSALTSHGSHWSTAVLMAQFSNFGPKGPTGTRPQEPGIQGTPTLLPCILLFFRNSGHGTESLRPWVLKWWLQHFCWYWGLPIRLLATAGPNGQTGTEVLSATANQSGLFSWSAVPHFHPQYQLPRYHYILTFHFSKMAEWMYIKSQKARFLINNVGPYVKLLGIAISELQFFANHN